ncbi:MAG: S8 family peptidase [Parashewanella sp.]
MRNKSLCCLIYIVGSAQFSVLAGNVQGIDNQAENNQNQYIVVLNTPQSIQDNAFAQRQSFVQQQASSFAEQLHVPIIMQFSHAINGIVVKADKQQLSSIKNNPNVKFVERDEIVSLEPELSQPAVEQDPSWGLDRIDQHSLPLDHQYHYNFDGTGVTAYIIDTGITATHEQFENRASGKDKTSSSDCMGHGTHVAGIIGSTMYGVAKSVDLVGVKVLDCRGRGAFSTIVRGVDWVKEHAQKPAVVNMSLGGRRSRTLDLAVTSLVDAGVPVVVAAGNSRRDACNYSPARVSNAITVGATDSKDNRSSFSNYGKCVDIFAPGTNIKSTWKGSSNDEVKYLSGTSMASPFVAGVVALYLQEDPNLTPAEIKQRLKERASPKKLKDIKTNSPNLLLYSQAD